jgi:hypothetical protein
MDKRKRTKGQTKIYKTLHRKLKIEQHESHLSSGMNLGTPEGKDVPAPHVGRNYCNAHQHESSRCHKKMMAGEIFPVIKTHISYFNIVLFQQNLCPILLQLFSFPTMRL